MNPALQELVLKTRRIRFDEVLLVLTQELLPAQEFLGGRRVLVISRKCRSFPRGDYVSQKVITAK